MAEKVKKSRVDMAAAMSDLVASIKSHDEGILRSFNMCIPACVMEYDREKHIAKVFPLVKASVFTGEWEYNRNEPIEVTVRSIQQGGFTIDLPLYVGDTGWIIASDRDTTLLKQEETFTNSVLEKDRSTALIDSSYPQKPHQPKCHVFKDGFFLPDNWGPFEVERFKDSRNVRLADALYIGQSIATKDDDRIDNRAVQELEKDEEDESKESDLQKGDEYEKRGTSSLVIEHWGAGHLLSSSEKDNDQTSRVTVDGNQIERELIDEKRDVTVHSIMSEAEGLYMKHDTKDNHFSTGFYDGDAMLQTVANKRNIVSIHLSNGSLTVQATGDVKVNSRKRMNISTSGKLNITTETATVNAKGDAEVFSRSSAQVMAQGNGTIKCGGKMVFDTSHLYLFSGGNMKMSGKKVNILGGIELTKLKEGKISISGQKIDMKVDWFDSKVFYMYDDLRIQGQDYKKKIEGFEYNLTGDLDIGCNMEISANRLLVNSGPKQLSIKGYTRGTVNDYQMFYPPPHTSYDNPHPIPMDVWKP